MPRLERIEQDGVVGELFLPDISRLRRTLVIVLGGSSGGLRHRAIAERLAADGAPALALAYFGMAGLPSALSHIPLEYFSRAIAVVAGRRDLAGLRLVGCGHSRGAELVLQLGSLFNWFAGVIATSPSHVRWGATGRNEPAWTFEDSPLPFVEPVELPGYQPTCIRVDGRDYWAYRQWYVDQLATSPTAAMAAIPVERLRCALLLFSGEQDQLWPSTVFADQLEARRRAASLPVENVQYAAVGHVFPVPGESPRLHAWHPALSSGIAYGGRAAETTLAATDRWNRILQFLDCVDESVTTHRSSDAGGRHDDV